jgi:putative flippase GtrA
MASSRHKELVRELSRFAIVGGSAVATDFVLYFALLAWRPQMSTALAKSLSFIAGAVLSFLLNRSFVFRSSGQVHRQIVPFTILYLVTLGLNTAVNAFALDQGVHKAIAWLLATGASTVANFLGMKLIVFKRGPV